MKSGIEHGSGACLHHWVSRLKSKLKQDGISVKTLAASLNIGERTLYRRLTGAAQWTLEDYLAINAYLDIPPIKMLAYEDAFVLRPLHPTAKNTPHFYPDLLGLVNMITQTKNSFTMIAGEMPFFNLISEPVLARFLHFVYRHGNPVYSKAPIRMIELLNDQPFDTNYADLYNRLSSIPSKELWGSEMLRPLLEIIKKSAAKGSLDVATLQVLEEALQRFVDSVARSLKTETKPGGGSLFVRQTSRRIENSVFLIQPERKQPFAISGNEMGRALRTMDERGFKYFQSDVRERYFAGTPISGCATASDQLVNTLRAEITQYIQESTHVIIKYVA